MKTLTLNRKPAAKSSSEQKKPSPVPKSAKGDNKPNPIRVLIGENVTFQTKGPAVIRADVTGYEHGLVHLKNVYEYRRKPNDKLELENEFEVMFLDRNSIHFIAY